MCLINALNDGSSYSFSISTHAMEVYSLYLVITEFSRVMIISELMKKTPSLILHLYLVDEENVFCGLSLIMLKS